MSLSFRPSVVLPGIAQPNDTINKKRFTYHLPLIHPNLTFHRRPTSQVAYYEGLIAMTAPTQTLPRFLNSIRSDTGRVGEEAPDTVESQFSLEGSGKLRSAPLGSSDPDLTFSTVYRSISPIWLTSVFSHTLLLNLVRARMGPTTTSFLIFSRSVMYSLIHSPHMI